MTTKNKISTVYKAMQYEPVLCCVCEKCNQYADELFSFDSEIKICSNCMKVEGLCQTCGDYIPMPDTDDEDDPLWQLDDSSDYAPTQCLECFSKNTT